MSRSENLITLLRNVDDASNFQFPSANMEKVVTIDTVSGSATVIDCSLANAFVININNTTSIHFDYSNVTLNDDEIYTMVLHIQQDQATQHAITFPNNAYFQSGIAPVPPAAGQTDILVCYTLDSGNKWMAFLAGEDMA